MSKMKKISFEETTTLISKDGESRTRNISIAKLPQEPPYVKLYLDDVASLHQLPANCSKLLYEFVKLMDYTGEVIVTKRRREMIAEAIGVSDKSVKNRITKFLEKGIVKRVAQNTYIMNPNMFAKGSWSDINKLRDEFKLTITYTRNGKRKIEGKELVS